MFDLGKSIGEHMKQGDLLLLSGPLGAGKTVFVQGLGSALGIAGITSPTFVISRTYKGLLPLIHVDAYRLLQSDNPNLAIDDLDLDTERENSVMVIEWGGEVAARLSQERLEISIDRESEVRKVTASGFGKRWGGFSL
ncbi:MAG: tRNA (adenosine(37)-N6)-threonylcarbamoyltransferase complex ATPase subunit type 1 TsaE [Actinobacteria bacterium]|nr:tRNA (adenosine(37)-N6)-threonylcarbamoyltransferase complex ATPase subunit type 1 TsaE [Actinomycetota bacterium]